MSNPTSTIHCPCGHLHPNGIGATMCGCKDCHLLTMDYAILGDAGRARRDEIRRLDDEAESTCDECRDLWPCVDADKPHHRSRQAEWEALR